METNTISLLGRAADVKKTELLSSRGIEELKCIKECEHGPLSVYSTFGGFWAVEYQGLAKVRLTLASLIAELTHLRELVYVMPPEDLRSECLERGWQKTAGPDASGNDGKLE